LEAGHGQGSVAGVGGLGGCGGESLTPDMQLVNSCASAHVSPIKSHCTKSILFNLTLLFETALETTMMSVKDWYNNNNHLTAVCPGQPG